jgi:hypothetical protein
MFGRIFLRLKSIASAFRDYLLATATARLIIIAAKLWANLPLLSAIVACMVIACLAFAGFSARNVFAVLEPASPSGIGAMVAATVAAVLMLELYAACALALLQALLQLAHDTGRHRVHAVLALASAVAIAAAVSTLWGGEDASVFGAIIGPMAAAGLCALTLWFQRAYRRPANPAFRDFRVDVVDARHFLMRSAHGG